MPRFAVMSQRTAPTPWWLPAAVISVLLVAGATIWTVAGTPVRVTSPAVGAWLTVWVGICVQAVPFLVLGVSVSGALTAFVPATALAAIVPRSPTAAVAAAGISGVVLPGCECASVPVSRSLMSAGVPSAPALTFLLAAPAVNPVVLVATAVAFPGQPMMAIARFIASVLAAWMVGWLWIALGNDAWIRHVRDRPRPTGSRWRIFHETATHDFLHAGGFLVLGSAMAATVNVAAPGKLLDTVASHPALAVLTMALLAVLVAICSEADAFVAASLTAFSPTAQLVFMTVSPMVDVKLISMQAGTFGPKFTLWFAPVTFAAAVAAAAAVGRVAL